MSEFDAGIRYERERIREEFATYAGKRWACPHAEEWRRAMADILDWLPTLPRSAEAERAARERMSA